MSKGFTKTVPVHVTGDLFNTPDFATITLGTTAIKRIKQLARAIKDLKVTYIEEFDSTPNLQVVNHKKPGHLIPWDGSSECVMLSVSSDEFHYEGIINNTDVPWCSHDISLTELSRVR